MGSLATHFCAFLFLFPIGLRRLLCLFSLYLNSPSVYRSKPWYLSEPRYKNIDLYFLIISLPIASFSEIFWFLTFSGHPTYRFAFFQQSAVISLFWVIVVLVILRENFEFFHVHENIMFLFAGIAFLIEYSMMGNDYTGLGGRVYELFSALMLVCAASCVYLSFKPAAFFADVALSFGLIFKGTWVLQAGLVLFTKAFSPKGCREISMLLINEKNDVVQCDLEEDSLRAVALINLLFVGHAVGILVMGFVVFGVLSCNRHLRCGGGTGPSLADIESESLLMHPLPEFEIEYNWEGGWKANFLQIESESRLTSRYFGNLMMKPVHHH